MLCSSERSAPLGPNPGDGEEREAVGSQYHRYLYRISPSLPGVRYRQQCYVARFQLCLASCRRWAREMF